MYRYGKRYFFIGIISILFSIGLIYFLRDAIGTIILICTATYSIFGFIKDKKLYFSVDEEKLILHKKNREIQILWKEVKQISAPHSIGSIVSQVCIYSDAYNRLFITWWINDYKELIQFVLEKCRNNDGIVIDDKVLKLINN